jgi:hypothetical protein
MSVATSFPNCPEDLTIDWLTSALHGSGVLPADASLTGFTTSLLGEGAGLMGTVVRIVPTYQGGRGPASIIGKFSTTSIQNQNTAAMLDLYGREVRFYTDLAPRMKGRCPVCYHAELSEDSRACVLLLEDFPDHSGGDQVAGASFDEARMIVIESARIHSSYWGGDRPEKLGEFGREWAALLRSGSGAAWTGMVERHAEVMPEYLQTLGEEYVQTVEPFHDYMSNFGSCTVVHGDMRLDNLLLDSNPGAQDPVVMIDFQAPLWAKGAQDLAYFLTQSVSVELRRTHEKELLQNYLAELDRLGLSYDMDNLWQDYRVAALSNFAVAVMISGLAPPNARAARFMRVTVERASAAFDDLDLLELLRSGNPRYRSKILN